MTTFLDTSVLIAALWRGHPGHAPSLARYVGATPATTACAAHSLAEVYAVTTRLPIRPRVQPEHALLFITYIRARMRIVPLDEPGYIGALSRASDRGIAGGRVYDALLLECARRCGAGEILTWNVSDFRRIAPDLESIIRTP